jgi:hypothetical protein
VRESPDEKCEKFGINQKNYWIFPMKGVTKGERRGGGVGRRRRLQWTCIKSNGSSATSSKSLTDPSLSCSNIFCVSIFVMVSD